MDDPESLLRELRNQNIELWVENDRLCYRSPPGRLSAQTAEQLRRQRDSIIAFLQSRSAAASELSAPAQVDAGTRFEGGTSCLQGHMLQYYDELEHPDFLHPCSVRMLEGSLDIAILQESFASLVGRHAALRSRFPVDGNGWRRMVIDASCPTQIETYDLRQVPEPGRHAKAQCMTHDIIARPFDVVAGPLVRLAVLRLGEILNVVVVIFHHAVIDALSLTIALDELYTTYAYRKNGAKLPEGTHVDLHRIAHEKRQWLSSDAAMKQMAYWRGVFGGVKNPFWLPQDANCSEHTIPEDMGPVSVVLPKRATATLAALCLEERATLYAAVLTAFALATARWTGRGDLCFWVLGHGRHKPEYRNTLGCFMDTWPLRICLGRATSLREAMRTVWDAVLDAQPNIAIPSQSVVPIIVAESGQPLERATIVNYLGSGTFHLGDASRQEAPEQPAGGGAFKIQTLDWAPQQNRGHLESINGTQLTITVREHPQCIKCSLQFDPAVFERATIASFVSVAFTLLEAPTRAIDS